MLGVFLLLILQYFKMKDAIDKSKDVLPLDKLEKEHVKKVVDKCRGNMSRAAELLGITRQTLYKKYQP